MMANIIEGNRPNLIYIIKTYYLQSNALEHLQCNKVTSRAYILTLSVNLLILYSYKTTY